MAMDMEISVTGSEPGKVSETLYCYVMNLDEPLHLHVEADFKVLFVFTCFFFQELASCIAVFFLLFFYMMQMLYRRVILIFKRFLQINKKNL
jgi:hypothetical protein